MPMSAVELSSIKWEENGEMSAQDALNLVCQLTKTEEHDLASSQLSLNLRRLIKIKPRKTPRRTIFAWIIWALFDSE
jgi:hypothetical protein